MYQRASTLDRPIEENVMKLDKKPLDVPDIMNMPKPSPARAGARKAVVLALLAVLALGGAAYCSRGTNLPAISGGKRPLRSSTMPPPARPWLAWATCCAMRRRHRRYPLSARPLRPARWLVKPCWAAWVRPWTGQPRRASIRSKTACNPRRR